ncbi:hypothetical protein Tco_0144772 [Tanacetum coccineum]
MDELHVRLNILRLTISPEVSSLMTLLHEINEIAFVVKLMWSWSFSLFLVVESRKSPTKSLFDADSSRISIFIVNTKGKKNLLLEDAESEIECLPNADIFEQLALMRYEKPSQKLTFYKAFFSPQWKFLIHTILQCLSAKSTSWNEFSSTMASAIICLATNQKFNFSKYIFESMVKNVDISVKFIMYPRFVQVFLDKQVGDMSTHDEIFVTPSHTKKVFGNMKLVKKGFSGAVTPLFLTMMVQAQEEMGKGLANPTDPHHTPIITQPSTSQPQKKEKPRKPKRKDTEIPQSSGPTEPIADEADNEENVPTHSNDPLLNEKKGGSRTHKLKRLFKVGRSAQVVSSEDEGLGDQEDASKQGRKIDDIDQDAKVTLVDETQGRYDDAQMFDTDVFNGEEVFVAEQSEKVIEEVVSTAEVSAAATITTKEITLAQALAELRSAKPKVVVQDPVQSTTTTAPSTIPKAKSITFRDPDESTTRTILTPIPSNIKDKGKAKMIEPKKPLKKKEQIRLDEELAFKL